MNAINYFVRRVRWTGRVLFWLSYDARKFWIAVIPFPATFLFCSFLPHWEQRLRICGLILQLCGIVAVAVGLHQTRRLFHRPRTRELFIAWFKRYPRFRLHYIVKGMGAVISAGATLSGVLTISVPETAPLLDRIVGLERDRDCLMRETREIRTKIQQQGHEQKSALETERNERSVQDEQTRSQLEEAVAGGLHLEISGVIWLAFGTVLATAPSEIIGLARFVH